MNVDYQNNLLVYFNWSVKIMLRHSVTDTHLMTYKPVLICYSLEGKIWRIRIKKSSLLVYWYWFMLGDKVNSNNEVPFTL